jgi:CheY-like chemotaxis protein
MAPPITTAARELCTMTGNTSEAPTGKTILVVEDNEVAREGVATVLRRHGYEVALAADGREALEHLATSPAPDLILLDMLMPGVDGWHFLKLLREQAPAIPVVVTTGTILTPEWAESQGCAGFLKKPLETEGLLAEVQRCLRSGGAEPR